MKDTRKTVAVSAAPPKHIGSSFSDWWRAAASFALGMRSVVLFLLLSGALLSATVDQLAVAVGATVITELQIDEDLRVAALLSGKPVNRDIDSRRAAADRLIQQLLIQHEITLSRYPEPSPEEVNTLYSKIEQSLGSPDHARQLLAEYQVSSDVLRVHLKGQLVALRFIEFRFRPDISISESEIEAEYRRQNMLQSPNSTAQAGPLSSDQRSKLSQTLLEQRTDAALDTWLAESRKQVNIVYVDSALQ